MYKWSFSSTTSNSVVKNSSASIVREKFKRTGVLSRYCLYEWIYVCTEQFNVDFCSCRFSVGFCDGVPVRSFSLK